MLAAGALFLSFVAMLGVSGMVTDTDRVGCSSPHARPVGGLGTVAVCWAIWAVPLVPVVIAYVAAKRSTWHAVLALVCALVALVVPIVEFLAIALATVC